MRINRIEISVERTQKHGQFFVLEMNFSDGERENKSQAVKFFVSHEKNTRMGDLDDDSMKFNLNLCIVCHAVNFFIQLMTFSSVIKASKKGARRGKCLMGIRRNF